MVDVWVLRTLPKKAEKEITMLLKTRGQAIMLYAGGPGQEVKKADLVSG